MARKSYTNEEIMLKLSLVMQKYNQGLTIDDACRAGEVGKATYFRWKKKYIESRAGKVSP